MKPFVAITRENTGNALDIVKDWYPEHYQAISQYRHELIEHIVSGTRPGPDSPLGRMSIKSSAALAPFRNQQGVIPEVGNWTPCDTAVAQAVLAGIFAIVGTIGLHFSVEAKLINKTAGIFERLPGELDALRKLLKAAKDSTKRINQALAIFSLLGGLWKLSCLKAILKAVFDDLSFFDLIRTLVILIAQLVAWLATDGAALVAELILNADTLFSFGEAIVKVDNDCRSRPTPEDLAETFAPRGSYLTLAEMVRVDLLAWCENGTGGMGYSSIDATNVPLVTEFSNRHGTLVEAGLGSVKPQLHIPMGSYMKTCSGLEVKLFVRLRNKAGTLVDINVDIVTIPTGLKIANNDGALQLEPPTPKEFERKVEALIAERKSGQAAPTPAKKAAKKAARKKA